MFSFLFMRFKYGLALVFAYFSFKDIQFYQLFKVLSKFRSVQTVRIIFIVIFDELFLMV